MFDSCLNKVDKKINTDYLLGKSQAMYCIKKCIHFVKASKAHFEYMLEEDMKNSYQGHQLNTFNMDSCNYFIMSMPYH